MAPATERVRRGKTPLFGWRESVCASQLPPTRKLVALVLSMHMNAIGGSCFPGMATIARESGLGRSTVIRALKHLQESGYLEVVERGGTTRSGRPKSNSYQARVPKDVTAIPVSPRHRSPMDTLPVSGTSSPGVSTTPEVVMKSSIEDERSQTLKPNHKLSDESGWGTSTNAEGLRRLEKELAEIGRAIDED